MAPQRDFKGAMDSILHRLVEETNALGAEYERARKFLVDTNPDELFYTVAIHDAWDNASSRPASGDATAQGLKEAIQKSEQEFIYRGDRREVSYDTNGINYYVYVHLGKQKFPVPEEFWIDHVTRKEQSE
jgi:hypothetical protein